MIPAICLMTASTAIILLLGSLHVLYTFHGPKLRPRERQLEDEMRRIAPVISRETTMWKTWIGFNASHGFGAMLFGLVYGYLGLLHTSLLFSSNFLLLAGLAMLVGYTLLGRRYWFSIPFRGITLALALYVGSIALWLTNT